MTASARTGPPGPPGPDGVLVGKPVDAAGPGDTGKAPVYNHGTGRWELVDIATQAELDAISAGTVDLSGYATDAELAAEATARAAADTAHAAALASKQDAATAATDTELAAEASARAAADTTLTAAAAAAQATANAALPTAGGTMTGKIVLDGDPTANLHPATKQWVAAQINALVNGAPSALDTLKEIADQLSTDESAVTALTASVAGKLAAASNLSDLSNAVTARTNLGLGSAATHPVSDFDAAGAAAAAQAASQPLDSDLTALAALTTTAFGRGLLTYANAAALLTGIGAVASTDARLSDQRTPSDGTVTNAKVATGAAIAYSKLALTGSIVVGDLAFDPATQAELDAKAAAYGASATVTAAGAGSDKDLAVVTDEAVPANATGTNSGLWQKEGGSWVRVGPRQKHGDNHAVGGIDPLFPSDIGEWVDVRRTSEVETVPAMLVGPSGALGSNGGVFALQARARTAGTFTQIRARCSGVGAAVTALRMGVWDSTGTKLAETADLVSSLVLNANLTANLGSSVTLTKGQIVYLGIAGVATTTLPSFNAISSTQAPASISPLSASPLTRTAVGWGGTALPALTATGATIPYWIVLL